MRLLPTWIAAPLVAAATVAALDATPQQGPVFHGAVQNVPIFATVLDGSTRLVTDLTCEDFQVFDNGRPQPVTVFDAGTQPISLVVMLDMSNSMAGNVSTLRRAAVQMFSRLLPDDRARVGAFGDRIKLDPASFTHDINDLIRPLWLDFEPGGGTPLWGAVNVAMNALAKREGRRVVLVLSDGKDTSADDTSIPTTTLRVVMQRAQKDDFMVYAIGLASRELAESDSWANVIHAGDEPDPGLRDLAADSGGGYFELHRTDAIGAAFEQVAEELHHQYLIGYALPETDGKVHAVELRVDRPEVTVRARHSYLAPKKNGRKD